VNGAKLKVGWDDLLLRSGLRFSPGFDSDHDPYLARGLGGCELGNHSHYFQGVARRELRHRLEAYATLRRRVVALGARNSPQKAFRQIARHPGDHGSIGFQPEASSLCRGFRG
jgi:hypothetical protein